MKKKRIPLRKCIACGENKPKHDLLRVVRDNESNVSIDVTGRANGRGAYICTNIECLDLVQKSKKLSKALESEVSNDIYENLRIVIESKMRD